MNLLDEEIVRVILNKEEIEPELRGKEIRINRKGKITYMIDKPFKEMTIAEHNFLIRRFDIMDPIHENMNIYYGHVEGLGYYVAEDEIDGENI